MRKVEEEKNIIEIQSDLKINENIILEKGDRIEVLSKIEEQKLNEDHFLSNLGPEFSALLTSAAENGVEYVGEDLANFFNYFAMDFEEVDPNITKLLKDLAKAAGRWAR